LVHHFVPENKTVIGVQSSWFDGTQKSMIAASERYCETLGKLKARRRWIRLGTNQPVL
jgi:hypothetical protein